MPRSSTTRRFRTLLAAAIALSANVVAAQRVQFPSTVPGPVASPYGASSSVLPGYDPYANTALGAPPLDIPLATPQGAPFGASPYASPVNPQLAQPFTPAPTLSPSTAPLGVPPAGPYGAPATPVPAGGGFFQNWNFPNLGLQQGTYDYQNPDGTIVRVQRLLQQLSFEHTYLGGKHTPGDLSINRTELAATFGLPVFRNPDTPVLITPGFAFNWLEGPVDMGADLPPRVYDAYLDTAWRPRLNEWFAADLGVRTGVWTDFDAVNSDSIRILGRGLGVVTLSPRLDVLAGVWYLDRNDVKILPAGGVHWRPNPEWDAYLVFPNPKIRRRFVGQGAIQWWAYAGGEYGGGRWTVRRDSGASDDIDINDIRVFGGLEWMTRTQARGHIEAGYVFAREIVYDGTRMPPTLELDDTFMVRGGFDF